MLGMMSVTDQMHRTITVPVHPQRVPVFSLVPSQSRTALVFGLGNRGRYHQVLHPSGELVGFPNTAWVGPRSLTSRTRALRPDLVIGNKEENNRPDIEALAEEFRLG